AAGLPPAGQLRDYLQGRLPDFMVPAVFTEVAALPVTAGGKVDRAALPPPDAGRLAAGGYVPPSGPAQELLAGIWAQELGVNRVGARDSFFALGGHSLLATQLISRIRAVLGAEITLAELFGQPTVAGLAALIEGQQDQAVLPPVTPARRDQVLPLSFAQQRLWFLD